MLFEIFALLGKLVFVADLYLFVDYLQARPPLNIKQISFSLYMSSLSPIPPLFFFTKFSFSPYGETVNKQVYKSNHIAENSGFNQESSLSDF
jgi:hypothetical protein